MLKRFRITTKFKSFVIQDISLNAESAEEAVQFLMDNINTEEVEAFEVVSIVEEGAASAPTTETVQ